MPREKQKIQNFPPRQDINTCQEVKLTHMDPNVQDLRDPLWIAAEAFRRLQSGARLGQTDFDRKKAHYQDQPSKERGEPN